VILSNLQDVALIPSEKDDETHKPRAKGELVFKSKQTFKSPELKKTSFPRIVSQIFDKLIFNQSPFTQFFLLKFFLEKIFSLIFTKLIKTRMRKKDKINKRCTPIFILILLFIFLIFRYCHNLYYNIKSIILIKKKILY